MRMSICPEQQGGFISITAPCYVYVLDKNVNFQFIVICLTLRSDQTVSTV